MLPADIPPKGGTTYVGMSTFLAWILDRLVYRAQKKRLLDYKLIAEAMNCYDVPGIAGYLLNLMSEFRDVHVDGARQREALIAPDCIQKLVSRHDFAAMVNEILQDIQLPGESSMGRRAA